MRKIELDAHIKKEGIEDLQEYGFSRAKLKIGHTGELDYYNVTLTVMVPDDAEKKVLVSESEFKALTEEIFNTTFTGDQAMKYLRDKLFGK